MKKRIVALLMILVLLLPELALASYPAYIINTMPTRSGPGTKYTEELGTLKNSTPITVISQAETNGTVWYQVEFTRNQKLYRCYTGKKRVQASGNIPWESPDYVEDVLVSGADAYYGPGTNYAKFKKGLSINDKVRVFGVECEWALCEYRVGNKWCRSYIHVDKLANTVAAAPTPAPTATPAPTPRVHVNIFDADRQLCYNYYGEEVCYAGRSEDFIDMVYKLPVLEGRDGIPCVESHVPAYSGPSDAYWWRYIAKNRDYTHAGRQDKNMRVFGREDGYVFVRYGSYATGGYRYAWIRPSALNKSDLAEIPYIDFARDVSVVTTRFVDATDDPDYTLDKIGRGVDAHIEVQALAFLDREYRWVYCEFSVIETNGSVRPGRGFIPADALRMK